MHTSLNLSLRFERKTATKTMNLAPYCLERYLRKKNYEFSIMKDAEFEQPRKALKSKQKKIRLLLTNYTQETTDRNERQRRSILPRCK